MPAADAQESWRTPHRTSGNKWLSIGVLKAQRAASDQRTDPTVCLSPVAFYHVRACNNFAIFAISSARRMLMNFAFFSRAFGVIIRAPLATHRCAALLWEFWSADIFFFLPNHVQVGSKLGRCAVRGIGVCAYVLIKRTHDQQLNQERRRRHRRAYAR
jgi:hypothetical protein